MNNVFRFIYLGQIYWLWRFVWKLFNRYSYLSSWLEIKPLWREYFYRATLRGFSVHICSRVKRKLELMTYQSSSNSDTTISWIERRIVLWIRGSKRLHYNILHNNIIIKYSVWSYRLNHTLEYPAGVSTWTPALGDKVSLAQPNTQT